MCFSINRELKLSAFHISDLRVRMVMHSTDCALCEGVLDDHEIIRIREYTSDNTLSVIFRHSIFVKYPTVILHFYRPSIRCSRIFDPQPLRHMNQCNTKGRMDGIISKRIDCCYNMAVGICQLSRAASGSARNVLENQCRQRRAARIALKFAGATAGRSPHAPPQEPTTRPARAAAARQTAQSARPAHTLPL